MHLGLSIWSADFHGSDWTRINAEKVTALALQRLESKKKGILLLHDIHERTASALPVLLRELKKRGYRVVHVVPASGAVAKIEEKPDAKTLEKTEQVAVAKLDENTPVKTEQAALTNPATDKPKQGTPVNLDHKNQKNAEGGWHTRIKRSRKVTASAKRSSFPNFFQALWQR